MPKTKFNTARAIVTLLERDPELAAELCVVVPHQRMLEILHLRPNGTPRGTPVQSTEPRVAACRGTLAAVLDTHNKAMTA